MSVKPQTVCQMCLILGRISRFKQLFVRQKLGDEATLPYLSMCVVGGGKISETT